jgi:hypothetical protein
MSLKQSSIQQGESMKVQLRRLSVALAAVLLAPLALGQASKMTQEDYAKLMQSNHQSIDAADAAVHASKFDDARDHVAVLRKNFMALRGFWSSRERTDAVRIVGDGMQRFAMIEELLGRPENKGGVPAARVLEATASFRKEVCAACHTAYREGSAETGFKFKDGVF